MKRAVAAAAGTARVVARGRRADAAPHRRPPSPAGSTADRRRPPRARHARRASPPRPWQSIEREPVEREQQPPVAVDLRRDRARGELLLERALLAQVRADQLRDVRRLASASTRS